MRISSGSAKGTVLKAPATDVRPTSAKVREALFDILRHQVQGACVLDLFAGTGMMGFEALSQGAKRLTAVEENPKAASLLGRNASLIKRRIAHDVQVDVVADSVAKALARFEKKETKFDLIIADPPYAMIGDWITENFIKLTQLSRPDAHIVLESGLKVDFDLCDRQAFLFKRRKYGKTQISIWSMEDSRA